MAALLVAMSIAAILMTVAMPVWKQMAQREKEEELIFRGQQYVRALRLFSTKYANASPPTLDVLVEQRFIRKKFKDPITNDDFQPILAGQAVPGSSSPQNGRGGNQGRGNNGANSGAGTGTFGSDSSSSGSRFGNGISGAFGNNSGNNVGGQGQGGARGVGSSTPGGGSGSFSPIGTPGAGSTGGVIGVVSKSTEKSIRFFNGRNHYNEWAFITTPQTQTPGAGGGRGFGTGRGQSGIGVPNPGQPPSPTGRGPGGSTSPFGSGIGGSQPIQPGRGRGQ